MIAKSKLSEILNDFQQLQPGAKFDADALAHYVVHRVLVDAEKTPVQNHLELRLMSAIEVIAAHIRENERLVCLRNKGYWYAELWKEDKLGIRELNLHEKHPLADALIQLAKKLARD